MAKYRTVSPGSYGLKEEIHYLYYASLKAWFRGQKYVVETLKLLPEPPNPIFIDQVVSKMAELGRVNHAVNSI
jgi:putative transposase